MPYPSNESLPPSVRTHLSVHAQDIYREAFNHARAAHAARTGRKKPPIASLGRREAILREDRQRLSCAPVSFRNPAGPPVLADVSRPRT